MFHRRLLFRKRARQNSKRRFYSTNYNYEFRKIDQTDYSTVLENFKNAVAVINDKTEEKYGFDFPLNEREFNDMNNAMDQRKVKDWRTEAQ